MTIRRVCFQIDEETYERAAAAAKADRRRLANWLALTVERALEKTADEQGQILRLTPREVNQLERALDSEPEVVPQFRETEEP